MPKSYQFFQKIIIIYYTIKCNVCIYFSILKYMEKLGMPKVFDEYKINWITIAVNVVTENFKKIFVILYGTVESNTHIR